MIWVIVGVAIIVVGAVLFLASRRRTSDGVESFQRHIDALSPEARRSVVDRVRPRDARGADARQFDDDPPADDDRGVDGA